MIPLAAIIVPLLIVAVLLAAVYSFRRGASPKAIIAIVIPLIIIGSVLVPYLQEDGTIPDTIENYSTLQYDDYILADQVDSASGAIELIQFDGHKYVHAKALGEGSYMIGEKTASINVTKADLDVFLILGQSNAAYFVYDYTLAEPTPKPGAAYYFGDSIKPVQYSTYSDANPYSMEEMIASNGVCKIGNIEPSFAAEYYELTGHKIYMINGAIPGMSILGYSSSGDATAYGKEILTRGMAAIDSSFYEVSTKEVIWIQGEADKDRPQETYRSIFLGLYSALSGGTWGYSFDTIVCSLVATGGTSTIVLSELARTQEGIDIGADIAKNFTIANGLMSIDGIHYSQIGDNLLGATLGKYCAENGRF